VWGDRYSRLAIWLVERPRATSWVTARSRSFRPYASAISGASWWAWAGSRITAARPPEPSPNSDPRGWTDEVWRPLSPHSTGVYVNTLGSDGHRHIREAYGPNYDRLARIKAQYDPENFFRMNQNIEPAA
jgi:hypothetical protein